MKKKSFKIQLVLLGLLMFQLGISSCKKEEALKPDTLNATVDKTNFNAGKSLLRESISPTSYIEFHELEDEVMITIDGHVDENPDVLARVSAALQEKTLANIYLKIFGANNSRLNIPQILLDMDAKYKTETAEYDNTQNAQGSEFELGEEVPNSMERTSTAKDANRFINLVNSNTPSTNENKYIRTNYSSAVTTRIGYYHVVHGMAASLTSSARFRGWYEKCYFSCVWQPYFDETLQPRHWRSHSWRGSQLYRKRKFQVDGNAPDKDIHFGVTWSLDWHP